MTAFVAAGAGFLLAVLWFDLMFDVQARGGHGDEVSGEALGSIAAYYARVTTAARPMSLLIVAVMLGTLVAVVAEIAGGEVDTWVGWLSLALAAAPILLALGRTVPDAARLGAEVDAPARQSALARSILRQHLLCAGSITALLVLQLSQA